MSHSHMHIYLYIIFILHLLVVNVASEADVHKESSLAVRLERSAKSSFVVTRRGNTLEPWPLGSIVPL